VRRADPYPLPARHRNRAGSRTPGSAAARSAGAARAGARFHGRDRGDAHAARPHQPAHQPAQRRFGAVVDLQFRDARRQRRPACEEDTVVHAGDDVASTEYVETLSRLPALRPAVVALAGSETPGAIASATEFVLEGLHLSKRLNKDAVGTRATYRAR